LEPYSGSVSKNKPQKHSFKTRKLNLPFPDISKLIPHVGDFGCKIAAFLTFFVYRLAKKGFSPER